MNLSENIKLAIRAVRSNWLRSVLTLIIIAIGISALVGILTAIDNAIYSLSSNLSSLGANTFDIDPRGDGISGNKRGRRAKRGEPILFEHAMEFKERFKFPARTSVSMWCTGNATIKFGQEKTNPNVLIFGVDENYLDGKGFKVEVGRNFTAKEALNGGYKTLIGQDVVDALFEGNSTKAIDKVISAGNIKLRVIGVLEKRGSSMQQSEDRRILIPLQTGKRYYGTPNKDYNLFVAVDDPQQIDAGISKATGIFRNVRGLKASQDNDFEITKSDSLIGLIRENTVSLQVAAVGIALITLLGAAIGLMNIMLVSVTERTREIGVCKALGATRSNIMIQFLVEAIVICLIGGLLGIIGGVLIGRGVSWALAGSFVFPWAWIIAALITCVFVGLGSGLYPALKASRLDPIESLRYE